MKKLLMVCFIVLGVSTLSKAQGGGQGRGARTPEAQTAALKTSLNLTADQEAKVLLIYKAQTASRDSMMKAMQGGGGAPDPSMMQKMMGMTTNANTKIKAVLTPEQAATFQKTVDAQAERMKAMMNGGGMGGPPPPRG